MSIEKPEFDPSYDINVPSIKEAGSFEELYNILKVKGKIVDANGQTYPAKELKDAIETLRTTINVPLEGGDEGVEVLLKDIPEAEGLAYKVEELYNQEWIKRRLELERQQKDSDAK